jgi:hypothetical protein
VWRSNCEKKIILLLLIIEIEKVIQVQILLLTTEWTTDVNESRVLATDLMHVSTELGNLGYNTGAYQGFT